MMMIVDRKTLQKELGTLKKSYRELLDANIKIMDEKKLILHDYEALQKKINDALEVLKEYNNKRSKKIIEILEGENYE